MIADSTSRHELWPSTAANPPRLRPADFPSPAGRKTVPTARSGSPAGRATMTALETNVFPITNLDRAIGRLPAVPHSRAAGGAGRVLPEPTGAGPAAELPPAKPGHDRHPRRRAAPGDPGVTTRSRPHPYPWCGRPPISTGCRATYGWISRARSPETDPICLRFPVRAAGAAATGYPAVAALFGPAVLLQGAVPRAARGVSVPGFCDPCGAYPGRRPWPVRRCQARLWQRVPAAGPPARRGFPAVAGPALHLPHGPLWYDIRLAEISDLTASEELIPLNGRSIPLLEWVAAECRKPIPPDLARLPATPAVVYYRNNQDDRRAAPAGPLLPRRLDARTRAPSAPDARRSAAARAAEN